MDVSRVSLSVNPHANDARLLLVSADPMAARSRPLAEVSVGSIS